MHCSEGNSDEGVDCIGVVTEGFVIKKRSSRIVKETGECS